MVSNLTFSTAVIQNSITNSEVDTSIAGDNTKPFGFLDFIVNTKVEYSPDEYNKFYIYYLKEWSDIKNSQSQTEKVTFVNYYVDFLKELTLTYSTQQEIRFLNTLNFNDPVDLDVAIPFYTEKIRQIILFFKEKRDVGTYAIDRNKIKGTGLSIEKSLYEKIYDYVVLTEDIPQYSTLGISLSNLATKLNIDIEEFVDVYGNYFDLPRVNTGETGLRKDYYTSNVNSIEPNLYFDSIEEIFLSETFLTEIPLAVTVTNNIDVICDPTNPLILTEDICASKCGFSNEERLTLKKKLMEKYLGVDFYFINTSVFPPTSGLFIKAENPTGNIQNLQTADNAIVQSNEQRLLRDIGIFFKPDKLGLFKLNASNYTYDVDVTKVTESKIYIFPDPNVYGNVSLNPQLDYPLVFEYDYRHDIRNISSGFATGDPYVRNFEQTFSPYYTREQNEYKNYVTDDSIYLNFADLYSEGYITKYQTDIFGNEYAIFKDKFGDTFKTVQEQFETYVKNLLLNGHLFFDFNEGYNFNYSTESANGTTIRSGLTSHTVDVESSPVFPLTGNPYYLYFREFAPYIELNTFGTFNLNDTTLERTLRGSFKDCGNFTFSDSTALPDPLYADYTAYPANSPYYYSVLVDAGVSSLNPLTRGMIYDDPVVTESEIEITTELSNTLYTAATEVADFTLDVKYSLSAIGAFEYDCGLFTDNLYLENDYIYDKQYTYLDYVSDDSKTVVSAITGLNEQKSQIEKRNLNGKIFVKNQTYSVSHPLSTTLDSIFGKYNSSVKLQLFNSPKDFDVIYDNIIIETDNYLVIDKITYNDGKFEKPVTKNTFFETTNDIQAFSNRFFNEREKNITFCITDTVQSLSSTNIKPIFPNIYQLDITTNKVEKVFPKSTEISTLSSIFSLSSYFDSNFNINIVRVDKPSLTYNSLNDLYKLTFTGIDNNNLFHMFDYEFDIELGNVTFYNNKFYKHGKILNTTNFTSSNTIFVNTQSISGAITINNTTGEIII